MKATTRNVLIGTAVAAVLGVTGAAVADMGGYGAGCPQGAQMQQGHGSMHGQGGRGMMGHGSGGMMSGMMEHGAGGMGGMMGGIGQGLDLSDEQRAEMSKIRAEFLPRMGELRGKIQANHEQLQALRHDGAADEAAIAELADQRGALIAEMIKLRSRHMARMQALLSDEQREQMRQRHQGMGMNGGMMGMSPMDG